MTQLRHPLLLAAPRFEGSTVRFALAAGDAVVSGGDRKALRQALERCDGAHTLDEVLASGPQDTRETLLGALQELRRLGVLADRDRIGTALHRQTAAPLPAGDAQTPAPRWSPSATSAWALPRADGRPATLTALLDGRLSAPPEAFGTGLTEAALAGILRSAYGAPGEGRRTVPSAGALTPLLVHVAGGPLARGVWLHDPDADAVLAVEADASRLERAFDGAAPARGSALLTIAGDLERTAAVYGNRGYRYVLLEAGAVMQNICVAACAAGVPVRPLGRFDDGAAADALRLPEHVVVLLGVWLG
jgi:SagB-type dehydrogenase family enzyme